MFEIAKEKIEKLPELVITKGSHMTRMDGLCVNEAYAFLAGERHSDEPKCVCPSIRAVTMRFNDRCGVGEMADGRRKRLLEETYLVVLGTRGSRALELRRTRLAIDWSIRVATPKIVRRTKSLSHWADRLEALPPLETDGATS